MVNTYSTMEYLVNTTNKYFFREAPTSYEDFCKYLMEKDDNITSERLNFKGRNLVLYWNPEVSA